MASSRYLISSTTLSSSASSVTFSSIPSTYTDLILKISVKSDRAANSQNTYLTLNGASTNYSDRSIYGNGTSYGSGYNAIGDLTYMYLGSSNGANTTNVFTSIEIYIPSYTASQNKPVGVFTAQEINSTTGNEIDAIAGLYSSTTAISSLSISNGSWNWVSGSTFTLYGLKSS